MNFIWY